MSLWQHLDALRGVLTRMAAILAAAVTALFIAMPKLFDKAILWPCRADFPLYRLFDKGNEWFYAFNGDSVTGTNASSEAFNVSLININLGSQLMVQMTTAMYLGLILTFPFLVYQLWGFVSPGLYPREKQHARRAFLFANTMFYAGIAAGYFVVFPIALRFLSQYQLSEAITNTLTLDSYIGCFMTTILLMGVVFELPLLTWLLGAAGVLDRGFFKRYRRYAIVACLMVSALVTPTGDPLSLFVVFIPIYGLWELGARLVKSRPAHK